MVQVISVGAGLVSVSGPPWPSGGLRGPHLLLTPPPSPGCKFRQSGLKEAALLCCLWPPRSHSLGGDAISQGPGSSRV